MIARGRRLDLARPAGNHRYANATLVQAALESAERTNTSEELVIDFLLQVRGPVVRRKHHQRIIVKPQFRQQRHDPADVPVQPSDHSGVRGPGRDVRRVTVAEKGRFVPLAEIGLQLLVRDVLRHVRDGGREVEKERSIPMLPNEALRRVDHSIRCVVPALERGVGGRVVRVGARRQLGVAGHGWIVIQPDLPVPSIPMPCAYRTLPALSDCSRCCRTYPGSRRDSLCRSGLTI